MGRWGQMVPGMTSWGNDTCDESWTSSILTESKKAIWRGGGGVGGGGVPVRKHSVTKVLEAGKHGVWSIAVKAWKDLPIISRLSCLVGVYCGRKRNRSKQVLAPKWGQLLTMTSCALSLPFLWCRHTLKAVPELCQDRFVLQCGNQEAVSCFLGFKKISVK